MTAHRILVFAVLIALAAATVPRAVAHCQVPCGIYDDEARFAMIEENLVTIEKAMGQIRALAGDPAEANQLVRWVATKEAHAGDTMEIISQYFLAQRIKAPESADQALLLEYHRKLASLHQMLVTAMKCKQTTDAGNVEKLRGLLATFHGQYFGEASPAAEPAHTH